VPQLLDPYTAIHLDCIGSNVTDYLQTLNKLATFVKQIKSESKVMDRKGERTTSTLKDNHSKVVESSLNVSMTRSQHVQNAVEQFLAITAMDEKEIMMKFNLDALLFFCDKSVLFSSVGYPVIAKCESCMMKVRFLIVFFV
jgi:hypothetical protein